MTLRLLLTMMLVTSDVGDAFQFRVKTTKRSSSAGVLEYKKGSMENNDEHHPHLKQGENILESSISRVLRDDTDCPLLKHLETKSSAVRDAPRTSIVPSTIDSLPSELVDINTFKNDMKVQARMRVPSFNAQGYKSSLVDDLKHQVIGEEQVVTESRDTGHHHGGVVALESNQTSLVRGGWKAVGAQLWLQLSKTFKLAARKSGIMASRLAKKDWSPLIQWVVLVVVLQIMCYHGIEPSAFSFHLM